MVDLLVDVVVKQRSASFLLLLPKWLHCFVLRKDDFTKYLIFNTCDTHHLMVQVIMMGAGLPLTQCNVSVLFDIFSAYNTGPKFGIGLL